jgi:hypothetical protein
MLELPMRRAGHFVLTTIVVVGILLPAHVSASAPQPVNQPITQTAEVRCADRAEFDLPADAPFGPKYCAYRKIFFEDYFFDGAIVDERKTLGQEANGETIVFADHGINMGFALVAFAGEAKILADAGLDTKASELIISKLLGEYNLMDTQAEERAYGWAEVPGYFVRDYMATGDFDHETPPAFCWPARPSLSGRVATSDNVKSDFCASNLRDKEISYDQSVAMLVGLWAVSTWAPDNYFGNGAEAQRHTNNLIGFLKDERFEIRLPYSDKLVKRGPYAQLGAGFLLNIAGRTLGYDVAGNANIEVFDVDGFDKHYHHETPEYGCFRVWNPFKWKHERVCLLPRIVWWDFDVSWDGGAFVLPVSWIHSLAVDALNNEKSLNDIQLRIDYPPTLCPVYDDIARTLLVARRVYDGLINTWGWALESAGITLPEFPDPYTDCFNALIQRFKFSASDYARNLVMLSMAFEADIQSRTILGIAEECSFDAELGYGHLWGVLLSAITRNQPMPNEIIVKANHWHDLAPEGGTRGSKSTDNAVWFVQNRFEWCSKANEAPGVRFNGIDFLSFDVLMHMQAQNSWPEVYVAKMGRGLELGTPELPYDTIQEGLQAAARYGKKVVMVESGVYVEPGLNPLEHSVAIESWDGGPITVGN